MAFDFPVIIFVGDMKALKNITICLIISLATFVWAEKECFLITDQFGYVIENSGNEESSSNTFNYDRDLNETDIALNLELYSFNIKCLSGQRIHFSHFIPSQLLSYSIWQPPKIS